MERRGREERAQRRREKAATKVMALGIAFVVVPLLAGGTAFGKSLSALMPLGLLMLAGGAALLRLSRKAQPSVLVKTDPLFNPQDVQLRHGSAAPDRMQPPERPTVWSQDVLDAIEWRRFEAVVETLFQQAGFETRSQSHGSDQGIDIWLYSKHSPGQAVSVVQCKHWTKRIGVDKMRELLGVMAAHRVTRGQFATTSTFTEDAAKFASANAISLLDVRALLKLSASRTREQQLDLLAVALDGEYWRPTCVNCGQKMVDRYRKRDGGGFWACARYACKTTLPMRANHAR
jgi:restriction system protein